MGNQSHTPGPWRVEWIKNAVYIKADDTDRNVSICRVMTLRGSSNVDILVQAPDMLDLLERLVKASTQNDFNAAYDEAEILVRQMKGDYDA